jgi:hypothetical protein
MRNIRKRTIKFNYNLESPLGRALASRDVILPWIEFEFEDELKKLQEKINEWLKLYHHFGLHAKFAVDLLPTEKVMKKAHDELPKKAKNKLKALEASTKKLNKTIERMKP